MVVCQQVQQPLAPAALTTQHCKALASRQVPQPHRRVPPLLPARKQLPAAAERKAADVRGVAQQQPLFGAAGGRRMPLLQRCAAGAPAAADANLAVFPPRRRCVVVAAPTVRRERVRCAGWRLHHHYAAGRKHELACQLRPQKVAGKLAWMGAAPTCVASQSAQARVRAQVGIGLPHARAAGTAGTGRQPAMSCLPSCICTAPPAASHLRIR